MFVQCVRGLRLGWPARGPCSERRMSCSDVTKELTKERHSSDETSVVRAVPNWKNVKSYRHTDLLLLKHPILTRTLIVDLRVHTRQGPAMNYISTDSGDDSSSLFPFRAWTNSETQLDALPKLRRLPTWVLTKQAGSVCYDTNEDKSMILKRLMQFHLYKTFTPDRSSCAHFLHVCPHVGSFYIHSLCQTIG